MSVFVCICCVMVVLFYYYFVVFCLLCFFFFHHVSALRCQCTSNPYTRTHTHTDTLANHHRTTTNHLRQSTCRSRSPASPSWLDEAGPSAATTGLQAPGASVPIPPNHLQKALTASTINGYMDGSDTRSISNDPTNNDQQQQQHQHQQLPYNGAAAASVVGGGGKLGYNNNQYASGAHHGESSEIMLGHIDDSIVHKQPHLGDNKSDQVDYGEQEGVGETETKSLSSVKSGGSNADTRYL